MEQKTDSKLILLTDALEKSQNGVLFLPKEIEALTFEDGNLIDSYEIKTIKCEPNSKLKKIAFRACGLSKFLEEIDLSNCEELTQIESFAFWHAKKLNKITFPQNNKIKRIGLDVFDSTNLEEIKLNNSNLEAIETLAFYNCKNLKIADFSKCKKLKRIGGGVLNGTQCDIIDFSGCTEIDSIKPNWIDTKVARFNNSLKNTFVNDKTYHEIITFSAIFPPKTKIEIYEQGKIIDTFEVDNRGKSDLEILNLSLAKRAMQLKKAFDIPRLDPLDINEFKTKKEMEYFAKHWKDELKTLFMNLVGDNLQDAFAAVTALRMLGGFGLNNISQNQVEQYKNVLAKKILMAKKIPATQQNMNKMARHTQVEELVKNFFESVIVPLPPDKKENFLIEMCACQPTAKINLPFAMFVVDNIDKILNLPSMEKKYKLILNQDSDFEECNENIRLATIYRNFDTFLKKSKKKVISRQKRDRFSIQDCSFANVYDANVILPGNNELSKLCGEAHISQKNFCKVQELFEKGKEVVKNNQQILTCKPDDSNSEITYEFIQKDNPIGMILGNITNCCQVIDNAGKSCLTLGETDPNSGFMALKYKNDIVGQAWLWFDKEKQVIALDNIEIPVMPREKINTTLKEQTRDCVNRFCKNIMDTMNQNNHIVKNVVIGKAYTELKFLEEEYFLENDKTKMFECPLLLNGHKPYSDATVKGQFFVYKDGERAYPVVEKKETIPLTKKEIADFDNEVENYNNEIEPTV